MKNNKQPEIRFSGFTEDWEQHKLGDITLSFSGGTPPINNRDYYNGSIPFIRSGEINSNTTELFITEEAMKNSSAKLVNKGDILYALYGATSGEVGISKIDGAINQAILAMKPVFNDSSYFISQWLRKQKQTIISTYLQGGQGNLSGGIVKKLLINIPSNKEEQRKVSVFLKQLDDTIALHLQVLDALTQTKKSFLGKMFPKEGEKFPEIRFPGFTEDWEQRKLGKESDVRDGTHSSPKYFDSGYPLITSKNLKHYGLDMTDVSFISHKDFEAINQRSKVDKGDILFGMIGTIGNPVLINRDNFAIKNVALIKEQKNVLNRFLIQLLKSPIFDKYIENEMAGGTQKFLSLSKIRSFIFRVPSTQEQVSISNFLGQLDDTIALHQRELELLQNTKKAFLQKMFV